MLLKVLDFNGVKYVIACTVTSARMLTFYCHNESKVESFVEALPYVEFQKRILSLNPRVKFPENAVRDMLLEGDAAQALMAAEPNPAGIWVMALRYVMAETPVALKWEWHLKPMETATLYRKLLVEAVDISHELHVIIQTLVKDLCAKDKELEQYRREGFELRRTTVRTKTFDLLDFNEENKDLLEEATAYNELNDVFPCSSSSQSNSREVSATPTTPSTPASSASGGTTISPDSSKISESWASSSSGSVYRCRKRKARALNIELLEQNIKQRILNPHVQFESQSSQEDNLAEWLVNDVLNGGIKQEPESESESKPVLDLTKKTESPQIPKAEVDATVKTEMVAEPEKATTAPSVVTVKTEKEAEPEKATTAPSVVAVKTEKEAEPEKATTAPSVVTVNTEKKAEPEKANTAALGEANNNESLTESDQELDELRAILAASMAQKREQLEK